MWIRRKVKTGHQLGRQLGHPTLNFNVGNFGLNHKPGVYDCEVRVHGKNYKGALYFGPKLRYRGITLEIYVLGDIDDLYGQFISFRVGKKLRNPKKFSSSAALKKQIQQDIARIV